MSEPCAYCEAGHLVTVRIPGHDDVEAVVCLSCGEMQLVAVVRKSRDA